MRISIMMTMVIKNCYCEIIDPRKRMELCFQLGQLPKIPTFVNLTLPTKLEPRRKF